MGIRPAESYPIYGRRVRCGRKDCGIPRRIGNKAGRVAEIESQMHLAYASNRCQKEQTEFSRQLAAQPARQQATAYRNGVPATAILHGSVTFTEHPSTEPTCSLSRSGTWPLTKRRQPTALCYDCDRLQS